jgi:hypothetical protein
MTGMLIWILRRHFANPGNIVEEELRDKIWRDGNDQGIAIDSATKFFGTPTQNIQQTPAIAIKRNTFKGTKLGIGDRYQGGIVGIRPGTRGSDHDFAVDSRQRHGVLIVGSHTVFCIGGRAGEAELVGTEAFFELLEFKQQIREDFGLTRLEIGELGGISKLEESDEHWAGPIVVSWAFRHDWMITPIGLPLKTVSINAE